jgi:hypothetical protein
MRIPREWQREVDKGRLLLVSPFAESQERATAELAQERNKFVATVADQVCFIYTTPGGTLELLAKEMREAGAGPCFTGSGSIAGPPLIFEVR